MPRSLRIAVRRLQVRFRNRRPLWWIAFWVYLGTLAVSSIFSNRGLLTSYRLWSERERLAYQISLLEGDVGMLRPQVRNFRNDPRTIERYAREELHLVGKDEIQYIFH